MASVSEGQRESNQALLFRLSTALKKVDRLKNAQANVLHRMEVARRITPGRENKSENFSPRQLVKAASGKTSVKSPLRLLDGNVTRLPAFPPSPVSKYASDNAKHETTESNKSFDLQIEVPKRSLSFNEALLTPSKQKSVSHRSLTFSEDESGGLKMFATDDNVSLLPPTERESSVKNDVGIVLASIGAKDANEGDRTDTSADTAKKDIKLKGPSKSEEPEVSGEIVAQGKGPSVSFLRDALRTQLHEKKVAQKAVEDMHKKMEEMHRHVQIAYKMKKVAENNLNTVLGDMQISQMEKDGEISHLKKMMKEMRTEHDTYYKSSQLKISKLKRSLKSSQTDLSGGEIHLHQYERQVNRLQAQIELLRRNMIATSRMHGNTSHSPNMAQQGVQSSCSSHSIKSISLSATPRNIEESLANYTPSILDALNIDMI